MRLHVWAPGFSAFQGGIGQLSQALAAGLRDIGHDCMLLGKIDLPCRWNDFEVWGAGGAPAALRTPRFALGLLAACARDKPDYIVSTHLNFGPAAHLAKRLFGTRYAILVHGIDVHDHLPEKRRAALRAADKVIVISDWTRRRLFASVHVEPQRVEILANTVDEARFCVAEKPRSLIDRYRLAPEERVVLTVARLDSREAYKGYDRVLQALPGIRAACGAVRYVLVGKGDDAGRIEAMTHKLGLERAVTMTGFVPEDELADHYRLADVFAMPSTGEGFGIAFLEALACGTPVLAGDRDGSVDAVDGGKLGRLVDPTDVPSIEAALIALLRREGPEWWFDRKALHAAVIERFGRAAFRRALQRIFPT
jgi:glycosyltransferase involved in cell wall biosynthesis